MKHTVLTPHDLKSSGSPRPGSSPGHAGCAEDRRRGRPAEALDVASGQGKGLLAFTAKCPDSLHLWNGNNATCLAGLCVRLDDTGKIGSFLGGGEGCSPN